jgi:broad specificity phosphatase PhoE
MTIWFLRHGQSQANLENRFVGRRDNSPLTDLGRSQALAAAAALPRDISWIVCSPLRRTTETAELIRHELGIHHEVEVDERLAGHDMGDATGLSKRVLSATEMVELFGAETPEDFNTRVFAALHDLCNRPDDGLVIAHSGVARLILARRMGLLPADFREAGTLGNGELMELRCAS